MTAQASLQCAGCGCPGHPPVILHDRTQAPPGAVLTPVFGWHVDGRPALLCAACRARNTGRRGKRTKPRRARS